MAETVLSDVEMRKKRIDAGVAAIGGTRDYSGAMDLDENKIGTGENLVSAFIYVFDAIREWSGKRCDYNIEGIINTVNEYKAISYCCCASPLASIMDSKLNTYLNCSGLESFEVPRVNL